MAALADDAVVQEVRGAGLWLTLNRPETLNGLSPPILEGILAGIDRAERDPAIRVLVLTSRGRAFCAGADLKHAASLQVDHGTVLPFIHDIGVVLDRMTHTGLPIVAAVPGIAAAGGLELLLCCDLVLLAAGARIGDAHANYGLLPGGGATARLPRVLGPQRAKHVMFTGDLLPASQAFELGLGTAVVDDGDLESHTEEIVASLAAKSPLVLAEMKRLIDDGLDATVPTAIRAELAAVALHERSYDQGEGLSAFNEKRRPVFEGR